MAVKFNPFTCSLDIVSVVTNTGASFTIIQPDVGTSPTATGATDTLTLHSSDSTITITGNSGTDTVNFQANASSTNTASKLVVRDSSGNFAAGTITASLTGAASLNNLKSANLSDVASVPTAMRNLTPATTTISASAIDWSRGNTFTKNIGSTPTTFTFSNTQDGQTITVAVTATTGTVTWPTVSWQGGTAPPQTINRTDLYTFIKLGSTFYGSAVQGF